MPVTKVTIIDVQANDVPNKNGKGTYTRYDVTYKDIQGKVAERKVFDFSATKSLVNALNEAKKGDVLGIEQQKDATGKYWNWVDTADASNVPDAPATAAAGPRASGAGNGYTRDFETREERQHRQVLIVRQSSLATAATVATSGGQAASADDVIGLAELFENYVFGNKDAMEEKLAEVE